MQTDFMQMVKRQERINRIPMAIKKPIVDQFL